MNGRRTKDHNRREFLRDVGQGMFVASLGVGLSSRLGLARSEAWSFDEDDRLRFGELDPLVDFIAGTPLDRLQPEIIQRLKSGTSLDHLIGAAALANARAFGGFDYNGYHAFMAMLPSLHMAKLLPPPSQPLPVLKVLYRNSTFLAERSGPDALGKVTPAGTSCDGKQLREQVRSCNTEVAEQGFQAIAARSDSESFEAVQELVRDGLDVHRVVLSWRAWDMRRVAGEAHGRTLLRQSVRHCLEAEQSRKRRGDAEPQIRTVLPAALERFALTAGKTGEKQLSDPEFDRLSDTILKSSREEAAEAVAKALADGVDPETVGEAMSLAAARLLLNDPGRTREEAGKPKGSMHGASVGVHASDAADAWRSISRSGSDLNRVASLIAGAYHTAGQFNHAEPMHQSALGSLAGKDAKVLARELESAIRSRDQTKACVAADAWLETGGTREELLDALLPFAVSEDGALHAEKYFATVFSQSSTNRAVLRRTHLVALARVCASQQGFPAPGQEEARRLLGLS